MKLFRLYDVPGQPCDHPGSIHPQGWVPVETRNCKVEQRHPRRNLVAFTPKGGCPLKLVHCKGKKGFGIG